MQKQNKLPPDKLDMCQRLLSHASSFPQNDYERMLFARPLSRGPPSKPLALALMGLFSRHFVVLNLLSQRL